MKCMKVKSNILTLSQHFEKKIFYTNKEYCQRSNLFKMIKRIVKKIKTKEISSISQFELKSYNHKTTYLKLGPRLAGRPNWLGGQIGWKDRLPWLGGQTGLYTLSFT